jgi:hypothetical protein
MDVCPLSAMLRYPAEVLWSVIRDQRIPNVSEEEISNHSVIMVTKCSTRFNIKNLCILPT